MSVYNFRSAPSYQGTSRAALFDAALDQPMTMGATFWDQAKGGIVESFGLGTATRQMAIPEGIVSEERKLGQDTALYLGQPLLQAYEFARRTIQGRINEDQIPLSEDAYKNSPYFRKDIPWDESMTEDRAAALASWYDVRKTREYFASKRPLTSFIGNLAGQAADPINYIPIAGAGVRAASIAKFGYLRGVAATSALDAAANTAVFGLATRDARRSYGDDVSWQAMTTEIAMAALIGGVFGTAFGVWGRKEFQAQQAEISARLSDLKHVQESRIALNEAIDGLVNDGEVRLSPNAVEPARRVAQEVKEISTAYDQVSQAPTGPVREPLVEILPEDIEGTIVSRGAFKDVNEVDLGSKRGWGLVKIIWGHGDQSTEAPEFRVAKEDITDLPNVIREYNPSSVSADGKSREWRVERNGRTIVYADSLMQEGRHVVTAYVQRPDRAGAEAALSEKRKPAAAGSLSEAGNPVQDTADQALPSPERGQPLTPARSNIGQAREIDNSPPRAPREPDGIAKARNEAAKPDNYRAMAEQYRVDPETGRFLEDAEIEQFRAEGRLTEDDEAALKDASDTYETGAAFGEALKAAVGCLI